MLRGAVGHLHHRRRQRLALDVLRFDAGIVACAAPATTREAATSSDSNARGVARVPSPITSTAPALGWRAMFCSMMRVLA
ncbi:hypothetical protein ISX56_30830 [Serratia ureilytica]|nr:hypothetical protein [Serratia ureilytica]